MLFSCDDQDDSYYLDIATIPFFGHGANKIDHGLYSQENLCGFCRFSDQCDRALVLIHDFYQTPTHLISVLNAKLDSNVNVIIPYMEHFTYTTLAEKHQMTELFSQLIDLFARTKRFAYKLVC